MAKKPGPANNPGGSPQPVNRLNTAHGTRFTVAVSRPPYICVHGPNGGCLRYEYNEELDIYGPNSSQVDCSTCKYF
jgi:hypothetical protein